ncbi:MAG: hypothetical protein QM770_12545 [Tepidisphaeraceae bacterium]
MNSKLIHRTVVRSGLLAITAALLVGCGEKPSDAPAPTAPPASPTPASAAPTSATPAVDTKGLTVGAAPTTAPAHNGNATTSTNGKTESVGKSGDGLGTIKASVPIDDDAGIKKETHDVVN